MKNRGNTGIKIMCGFIFSGLKNLTLLQKCVLIISSSSILYIALVQKLSFRFCFIILSISVLISLIIFTISVLWIKKIYLPASFFLIFVLSAMYLMVADTPFLYPTERFLTVNMKIISDLKSEGKTISFKAKVLGVKEEKGHFFYNPGYKVLANLPQSGIPLERGCILEARGIFMDFSTLGSRVYAVHLKSTGLSAIFEGQEGRFKIIKRPSALSITGIANRLKGYIWSVNEGILPWPHNTFATALITGMREQIPSNIQDRFIKSGTMHILAVSGLHVGFIIFMFGFILRSTGMNMIFSNLILGAILIFYMLFVGSSASVIRASIMALCGIAMLLLDRDRNYFNVLSIAFLILWLLNPFCIINSGFLLSFTATFAILFLVPYFMNFFKSFMTGYLSASISLSFGIQLYIIPVMLYFFGAFPYINIIANIPVVPLAGLSLALEILYLLFYLIFLPFSVLTAEVNTLVVTLIIRLASFFGQAPLLRFSGFPLWGIPLYLFAITMGFLILVGNKHTWNG